MSTTYGNRLVLTQTLYTVNDATLKAMGPRTERRVQDALFRLGQQTRDMARQLCPVKTGTLRQSIYVSKGAGIEGPTDSPHTRQSHVGYFRAVNAAIKKNKFLELGLEESVHEKTQRPHQGSNFKVEMTKIGNLSFKSFATGEVTKYKDDTGEHTFTEFQVPSIMELGKAGRNSFFVTVGTSAFYAGYVEFGHGTDVWGWVPPKPFLRPALEWAKTQLPKVVGEAVRQGASNGGI